MPSQIELQFRANGGGQSQNERLAAYLRERPWQRVPMPELAQVITPTGIGAAVHSRVADCRKKFGMTIAQYSHKHPITGLVVSEYCFEPAEELQASCSDAALTANL